MTARFSAPILALVGMVAMLVLGLALGTALAPTAAPPPPAPTNMELLGQVTTVVDADSPLVRELKADDRRRELQHRDDWN